MLFKFPVEKKKPKSYLSGDSKRNNKYCNNKYEKNQVLDHLPNHDQFRTQRFKQYGHMQ